MTVKTGTVSDREPPPKKPPPKALVSAIDDEPLGSRGRSGRNGRDKVAIAGKPLKIDRRARLLSRGAAAASLTALLPWKTTFALLRTGRRGSGVAGAVKTSKSVRSQRRRTASRSQPRLYVFWPQLSAFALGENELAGVGEICQNRVSRFFELSANRVFPGSLFWSTALKCSSDVEKHLCFGERHQSFSLLTVDRALLRRAGLVALLLPAVISCGLA
jgi:hypothetical protein